MMVKNDIVVLTKTFVTQVVGPCKWYSFIFISFGLCCGHMIRKGVVRESDPNTLCLEIATLCLIFHSHFTVLSTNTCCIK